MVSMVEALQLLHAKRQGKPARIDGQETRLCEMVLRCPVIRETVELLSRNLQAATEHATIMGTEPRRLST